MEVVDSFITVRFTGDEIVAIRKLLAFSSVEQHRKLGLSEADIAALNEIYSVIGKDKESC